MAYCPQCRGEMEATETVCPHCGFDFPDRSERRGFAYSSFADIALIVGSLASAFGCLVAALFSIFHLFQGDLLEGLVYGPLAVLVQLAWLVVFLRIQDL